MSVNPVTVPNSNSLLSLIWRLIRSRLWWLVLMFVSGAIVGSAVTVIEIKRMRSAMMAKPEMMIDLLTSDIRRDAQLNDEEAQKIRAIVAEHHQRMMVILPQIGDELDVLQHDVAAALTSSQRERWEPKFKQFRRHMFP